MPATTRSARTDAQYAIEDALKAFSGGAKLHASTISLLDAIGYRSQKRVKLDNPTAEGLREALSIPDGKLDETRAMIAKWSRVEFLFQLGDSEVSGIASLFDAGKMSQSEYQSFLFVAVELKGEEYKRSELVAITRELNRPFLMPVIVLFYYGGLLTLSIIDRRLNKRQADKDVLEKVTLIKDIRTATPSAAHRHILADLSLSELARRHGVSTFTGLHEAWKKTLNVSELNKRFYKELAAWYEWAVDEVQFPADVLADGETRNPISVIRLITRLVFIWFLKEKGLVPEELFIKRELDAVLAYKDKAGSTYYKAILQNLFFATLNAPMNRDVKEKAKHSRTFIERQHGVQQFFRYGNLIKDKEQFQAWMDTVPFLNGGLFECLDKRHKDVTKDLFIDGFTQQAKHEKKLRVPDDLFFSEEHPYDLNSAYGTKGKKYTVRGLINILSRYKFTIEENTPVEEEVALDPELLGKVFENLLASYNEETKTTARKMTGSFYTPREIVAYMVDESLIAYLKVATGTDEDTLRKLAAYTDVSPAMPDVVRTDLVAAIDRCTILDPACGSGAFPMGVLQKLVHLLSRLDPNNTHWRALQRERAIRETEEAYQLGKKEEREARLIEISETFEHNNDDYGRKLYLIENCIYGVDKQPIAVQIAKLRFFISLVVDQRVDDERPNRGVRALPNLETKFVAGNTLVPIVQPVQTELAYLNIEEERKRIEKEIHAVREKHFRARTSAAKDRYREQDAALREQLAELLEDGGFSIDETRKLSQWNPYDQNSAATFFDPRWMFDRREGFDVVIGNPPYLQMPKMNAGDKAAIERAAYKTFLRGGDLYLIFYERGINLTRKGGHLCYITSNSWMQTQYGLPLRVLFNKETQPQVLLRFENAQLFESAIVETNVILLKRERAGLMHSLNACTVSDLRNEPLEDYVARHSSMLTVLPDEGWAILSEDAAKLKQMFERKSNKRLADWAVRINRGVLTGFDKAFFIKPEEHPELMNDPKSAEIIKPALRGRDLKRWGFEQSDEFLIFTRRGLQIDKYPAVKEHLSKWREFLEPKRPGFENGRKPGPYKWYDIQDNVAYWQDFEQPKIVWAELSDGGKFALDEEGHYPNKTLFILTGERLKYLLGIFNSKAVLWYYSLISASSGMGATMWQKVKMVALPIPVPEKETQKTIEALVDLIHLAAKGATGREIVVSVLENVLNGCVYELYLGEEMRSVQMDVLALVADDLKNLAGGEAAEHLTKLCERWSNPKSEVRNRLLLMATRCPNSIGLIEKSL